MYYVGGTYIIVLLDFHKWFVYTYSPISNFEVVILGKSEIRSLNVLVKT